MYVMVWYSIWYGIVWYRMVSSGIVWYHIVFYRIVLYNVSTQINTGIYSYLPIYKYVRGDVLINILKVRRQWRKRERESCIPSQRTVVRA